RGVLAPNAKDEGVVADRDLEVPVGDPAAEQLEHYVAAGPDACGDLLRLHRAILDWRAWPSARCCSTSTGRSPTTSRFSARSSRSSSPSSASPSPKRSTTTGWPGCPIPRSS